MRWFADFGRSPKKVLALKQASDRLRLPIFVYPRLFVRCFKVAPPGAIMGIPAFNSSRRFPKRAKGSERDPERVDYNCIQYI